MPGHRGAAALSPRIAGGARAGALQATRDAGRTALGLTRREIDLLRLLARGLNNKDIARELEIGEASVQQQARSAEPGKGIRTGADPRVA